jgi:copper transport protein
VATLVLTGVYQAWRGVGSIDALAGSSYGRLLLFKVVGIGILLWLGALSNSAVRRGYTNGTTVLRRGRAARDAAHQEQRARVGLRRSVGLETATAVAVLAVTSLLVSTPPGSRPAAPIAASTAIEADLALPDGARVSVTLDPARVGASRLALTVHNRAGTDWDVPEVSVSLYLPARSIGPLPVALSRLQAGRYQSQSLSLPAPGGWRLRISVRTSDFDQHTVETEVAVK